MNGVLKIAIIFIMKGIEIMAKKIIENKGDFFTSLTEEEQKRGYIIFNIQSTEEPDSLNEEAVWGWVTPEDKEKYDDDSYTGNITAILLNEPFGSNLSWGDEVILRCNGSNRPTLDTEWMTEYFN